MDDDKTKGEGQGSTETVHSQSPVLPERVGPYRILDLLGEGGMGVVYLAEQTAPVRRKIALKIIKHGMDTKHVVARFEAERQALAMMDHPCVAKVFDAGSTEGGRPYFAMEHVQGVPITAHCDRQRLTTRERLELFQEVCEGVQHAHQKAIIHRDLKPSNVLVSYRDGKITPKIIDFGIAKAIDHRLTEKTLHTEMGVLIGTPEYMSPEQAEMGEQNVDTRTDVYSLGVVLYELLVGALPVESKKLRVAGFDEVRRKIREDEPSKPSARLSTLGGERLEESAQRRKTDPSTLRRQLSGDLDWITMRALEKDRARRYGSPSEFAADLERHLTNQPVLARPPSAAYRARKFVRRHRVGVAVAAAVVILLTGFALRERIQLNRIAQERDRANQEAETAKQALDFMTGMFEVSDPSEARGNTITAREILDKGANEIDESLADQPEVQARLMGTMGHVYRKLGLYEKAELLLEQALATKKRMLGGDHPDTLASQNSLASLYLEQGHYDEAETLYVATLENRKRVLGGNHPDTLVSMNNLAILYSGQGHYDEAETLHVETLETQKRVLGDEHPDALKSMNNLAILYLNQGRYDEAEPLVDQGLATAKRVLGDDHPDTLLAMNNLANLYLGQNRYDEAEPLFLQNLEAKRRVLGEDHPDTLSTMKNLATLYGMQGHFDEEERLRLETIETERRVEGEDHPATLENMNNLAVLYTDQGRFDEARQLLEDVIAIDERARGTGSAVYPVYIHSLGEFLLATGDLKEAEQNLRRALEIYDERGGHEYAGLALYQLAGLSAREGERDQALDLLRQALDRGYADASMVENSDLASLHGDPGFEAIVAEVKKRLEEE